MKTCTQALMVAVGLVVGLAAAGGAAGAQPAVNPPFTMFKDPANGKPMMLPMIQRSVLNGVPGKINQMAVEPGINRLYVAAKAKNTLEILDVTNNKQQPPIVDLPEPNGVFIVPDLKKLVVSCGGDSSVRVFKMDAKGDLTAERKVNFAGETESVRYDAPTKRVYVSHGKNIGSFNIETGEKGKSLELAGMAKSFCIDGAGERIYVNMPAIGSIAVVKRTPAGDMTLETTWKLKSAAGNYPMALDAASGHLFTVVRSPASALVVLDVKTGEQVGEPLPCVDQVESLWWDPVNKYVYASGGGSGGRVDIFKQGAPVPPPPPPPAAPMYTLLHKEVTNAGAGTSVLVPEQRRLIVAAPQVGGSPDPTFLYVYLIGP